MVPLFWPAQKIPCWVGEQEQVGTASDGAKVALRVAVAAGETSANPKKMVRG